MKKLTLTAITTALILPLCSLAANVSLYRSELGNSAVSYRVNVPWTAIGHGSLTGNDDPDVDYSVGLWFNPSRAHASHKGMILGIATPNHNNQNGLIRVMIDTAADLTLVVGQDHQTIDQPSGLTGLSLGNAPMGQWHYLLLSINNTDLHADAWLDGTQVLNQDMACPITYKWDDAIFRVYAHGITGYLDQAEFYSTALTAEEAALARTNARQIASLNALYTFESVKEGTVGRFTNQAGPCTDEAVFEKCSNGEIWGEGPVNCKSFEYTAEFGVGRLQSFIVTIGQSAGGTVTATSTEGAVLNGDEVLEGTELTLTATPTEGYELQNITANGQLVSGNKLIVTSDVTIAALFTPISSLTEITAETGANPCYDLQGRRVAAPTRGLYICGGRKVIL